MTRRAGVALVELLVAATLGALICSASVAIVLHVGRATSAAVARDVGFRIGGEGVALLEALGRHLRYPVVIGDSALGGDVRIVAGVVCRGEPSSVTLAPAGPEVSDALAFLADVPAAGDRLEVLVPTGVAWEHEWDGLQVTDVSLLSAAQGCGATSPFVSAADRGALVVRLSVTPPHPRLADGVAVEVYRSVRIMPYRTVSHDWMIGFRSCVGDRCSTVEPMVGPVRSPADGGLRFRSDGVGVISLELRVPQVPHAFLGIIGAAAFSD